MTTRRQTPEPAPLRLELENEWAWCGERRLDLPPRAFAVLRHLTSHPGRLVTKTELLDVVWGRTVVSEAALTSCIRDLRRALADSSRSPRYLETVHRRGFRFIGPLASDAAARPAAEPASAAPAPASRLVGREDELARLHASFAAALGGRRQVVFVTGEAGIGKTALLEAFLARISGRDDVRVGRGQCIEQYGAGEAYLPVLEALGRMGRDPGGGTLVSILRQYAPSWLAQLAALLEDEELAAVQRRSRDSTRERMLRELVEALDAVCEVGPLVLLLEDLHWSDSATIDLLGMLARRRDPARLLVAGTYRPADVAAVAHPLLAAKRELQLHGHCEELMLEFLSEAAVGDYLAQRAPHAAVPPRLARVLHRNTGGNPLFLVNVVDDLIARGRVRESEAGWELVGAVEDLAADVPRTLWQMVDEQVERLSPEEQAVLVAASVAGAEFSAALVATDGVDEIAAEQVCAALARRGQLVRAAGTTEWPDGTVAGRYAFIHALYRNVLYARTSGGRRVGLHLRIGDRLERAHGARGPEVAGELAMHFEEGRDLERAVRYRRHAAESALRHHAHREAAAHAKRAVALLSAFSDSPERLRQELALQTILGAALIPRGSADPEVVRTYARANELCARVGVAPELFPALVGLSGYYISRADLGIAREVADRFSTLAAATEDAAILLGAHNAAGMVSFYAGEFAGALDRLERGLEVYDPGRHAPGRWPAFWGGHDPGVSCASHAAWASWVLGSPGRAAARMEEAIGWARSSRYAFTLANACSIAAVFHACRGDLPLVRALSDEAVRHSTEHGFPMLVEVGAILDGWLLSETGHPEEGAARMRSSIAAYRGHGAGIGVPTFLGFLAQAYGKAGRRDEGLAVLAEALRISEATGAHYWDAELRRVEGALLAGGERAARGAPASRRGARAQSDAEASFAAAVDVARGQQAGWIELRATSDLCRLWKAQGKAAQAHAALSAARDRLPEGFDTAEWIEAAALLAEIEEAAPTRSRAPRDRRRG